ncbi:glycosyltransferase family 2 protein [Caenimonas koreensis]|uniref:Glycosyltransferase n=1 Tax=Caenimonas koreensis DSM 17982 TaxID=1121255 RepID=A0A844B5B4_9BURK|nr:glycosyltransferase family 2 protein [Caenimonas koreensis]MRD46849.1 glycosyltransferase [Caenimonas koreensis DSM 17982]
MPLHISVITAVLNRANTLGESLASVHGQSWSNVEHIVIDGGSTDGTLDVIEQYRGGIAKLTSSTDAGPYYALNKGIAYASGDVIGFMHADDMFASQHALERIAGAFEDPSVDAVYGDLVYVRKEDSSHVVRYWRAGQFERAHLTQGWMPPHPTFYVRRELYARFGDFDTRYKIAADYDHMLRLLWRAKINAAYVPEVLVRMRMGGLSNRSIFNMVSKSREDYTAMRENGIGGLQTLLLKNVTKLPQFMVRAAPVR